MRIGIVDMYGSTTELDSVVNALARLGHSSYVINHKGETSDTLLHKIRRSPIRRWILTGSDYHLHDEGAPKVPLGILDLPKQFLLICYSMESLISQVSPAPIKERYENKKEIFHIPNPMQRATPGLFDGIKQQMVLRRNHLWYFPTGTIAPLTEISAFRGEVMIAVYKNCLLTQFHPEKTPDGLKIIKNWLEL